MLLALAKSVALYGAVVAADAARRTALTLAGYLLAAGLFAVSLCFLTLAAYRALAEALGGVQASLIVGCVYLVAGLVAMLVVQFRGR